MSKAKIFIVNEENHGDVSYWTNENDALAEVKKIIRDGWSEEEIKEICLEENIPYATFWLAFEGMVCYYKASLNTSWVD